MIVTVAQRKGGAGKTTLLVQLATALAARGRRVAVVDTDPQASLSGWMRLREHGVGPRAPELRLSTVGGWRLGLELDRLRRDADDILVDTPPHAEAEAKVAVRAADLVAVPLQPSPADLWASGATVALAAQAGRRAVLILNRAPARGRSLDDAVAAVGREGWPLAAARLGNRQAFVSSFARGLGAVEAEPRGAAAAEVFCLLSELSPA